MLHWEMIPSGRGDVIGVTVGLMSLIAGSAGHVTVFSGGAKLVETGFASQLVPLNIFILPNLEWNTVEHLGYAWNTVKHSISDGLT